jgi:hypothetical protein
MIRNTEDTEVKRPNHTEVVMEQVRNGRIVEVVLGFVFVVGIVFSLRLVQFSGAAIAGAPSPDQALRNYQNRIHATEVMLETGRLEVSGS